MSPATFNWIVDELTRRGHSAAVAVDQALKIGGSHDLGDEAMGIAWWNELTPIERWEALDQASRTLGREVSPAEAWRCWHGESEPLSVRLPVAATVIRSGKAGAQ